MIKKRNNRENLKWNIITIAGLFLVLCIILRRYIFEGYMFFSTDRLSDLLRANLPTYYMMYDSIVDGGNFWSWKMGIGTSMFSHADVYFDPFTYIVFLLGRDMIPKMMLWSYVVKLVCQSMSMTAYLRFFRLDNRAVCIASILYSISGYSLIMGSNFALGTVLVYFPLLLLGAEIYLKNQKRGILLLTLVLMGFYSYYFFYISGLILAIYIIVRAKTLNTPVIPKLFSLLAIGIVSILCSALAILPQIQLVLSNARTSSGKDVLFGLHLFIPQMKVLATTIARLFNNDILGNGVTNTYFGWVFNVGNDYFQLACYTGSLFWIMFLQLWHYNKKSRKVTFITMMIVILGILFPIVSYIFNAFSTINYRWMYIVTVLIAILYAFAIDAILKNHGLCWKSLISGIVSSYFLIVCCFFVLGYRTDEGLFSKRLIDHFLVSQKYVLIISTIFGLLIFINFLLQSKTNKCVKKWFVTITCMVMLMIEGFGNYYHWYGSDTAVCEYNNAKYCGYEDSSKEIIKEIQNDDTSFYRIYKSFDSVVDNSGIPSDNDAMAQGYYGIRNYSSMNNTNYIRFLQTVGIYVTVPANNEYYKTHNIEPEEVKGAELNFINGVCDSYALMNFLGVKYYLDDSNSNSIPRYFKKIGEQDGIVIYKNEAVFPLAFVNPKQMSASQFKELDTELKRQVLLEYTVLDEPNVEIVNDFDSEVDVVSVAKERQKAFNLIDFTEDRIEFEIDILNDNQYISFTIPYDEDFHVYIDGEEAEIHKINISLLGVKVDSGKHNIIIKYKPRMVFWGFSISIILIIVLWILRKRFSDFLDSFETKVDNYSNKIISIIKTIFIRIDTFLRTKEIVKKTKRESNFELCRIVCMIAIIAHHCVAHGGSITMENHSNKVFALFLLPLGKLCFDCFLAMSCWFLVDKTFKAQRFLKIWFEVLFYSVLFALIAQILGEGIISLNFRNWLSVFWPITGNSHGFAASYLAFYLLLPFLTKVAKNITKKQARWLMILSIYFNVVSLIIGEYSRYTQPLKSELTLFIMCYIITLNLKRWPIKIIEDKNKMILIFGVMWFALWILRCLYVYYPENEVVNFLISISGDESSITNLIGGYALFFFFKELRMKKSDYINVIAATTFGVLLIHDHNFFRYVLWLGILSTSTWYYSEIYFIKVLSSVIFIFVACMMIDLIRIHTVERVLFSSKRIQSLCKKIDDMLEEKDNM